MKDKLLASIGTGAIMGAIMGVIIIASIIGTDWSTMSNSGSMKILRDNGTVTFKDSILIYYYDGNTMGKQEFRALAKLSNLSKDTYVFPAE